jgi:nicotinate-nucleotide adenylyltransferase
MSRTLIFGGAFNPVHIGHLRAAIEVSEALGFERVEWIPSFAPLHKADQALLPFEIRVALLRAALDGHPTFSVDTIEQALPTPSVTVQTLEAMVQQAPSVERHFLLGDREFMRLHKWRGGSRVVELANIVVVCRTEVDLEALASHITEAWPHSRPMAAPSRTLMAFELIPGRHAAVMAIPRIEVSSSLVREYWLQGRSVAHLVPAATVAVLDEHRDTVRAAWFSRSTSSLRAS